MKLSSWILFTKERFHPLSHIAMILSFVLTIQLLFPTDSFDLLNFIILLIFTLFFFFKLRLYDEIKDYELDKVINPTRPLVRGLLNHKDLYWGIALCISIELSFSLLYSLKNNFWIFPFALIPILYSLLMYKEFFISKYIRPLLTTYAVTHTFVSLLLTLFLISSFAQVSPLNFNQKHYSFGFAAWFLFNIFEFGRKTFTTQEERNQVESYSKIWGRSGATGLVLTQGWLTLALLNQFVTMPSIKVAMIVGYIFLLVSSALYVLLNKRPWGIVYRTLSSAFIVFCFSLFIIQWGITIL